LWPNLVQIGSVVSEKNICGKVYRRTTTDRPQEMAIAHMAFWPVELKTRNICEISHYHVATAHI